MYKQDVTLRDKLQRHIPNIIIFFFLKRVTFIFREKHFDIVCYTYLCHDTEAFIDCYVTVLSCHSISLCLHQNRLAQQKQNAFAGQEDVLFCCLHVLHCTRFAELKVIDNNERTFSNKRTKKSAPIQHLTFFFKFNYYSAC